MQQLSHETLDELYSERFKMIESVESATRNIAMNVFALLLCLHEALAPGAFLAAVAKVEAKQQYDLKLPDLLRICHHLVMVDSRTNTLRFAHTSVQDFLAKQPGLNSDRANEVAASSCINTFIYNAPIGMGNDLLPTQNFSHYGALYWAEHCKQAAGSRSGSALSYLVNDFVYDGREIGLLFSGWLSDIEGLSRALPRYHSLKKALTAVTGSNPSPLFTACVFGLLDLLIAANRTPSFDWNQKNHMGQPGLYLASAFGHRNVVQFLLDHGADINASGGRHGNALQAACLEGHSAIALMLLENGADVRLSGRFGDALQACIVGDQEQIALSILKQGFEIRNQDAYDRYLQEAAQAGQVQVVHHLEQSYKFTYAKSPSAQQKAIESAIFKGQLGMLERFVSKMQDPSIALPDHSLSIAAMGGENRMIQYLFNKDFDLEQEGDFGRPLRVACVMGHESTVRLLLDLGANVGAGGSFGDALQAAAMKGHAPIAKMLLQKGADVNAASGYFGNALQAAAYHGHEAVAKILLDAGAEVHYPGFSKDAFHAASEGGHEQIVRLFLEKGFRFREPLRAPAASMLTPPPYRNLLRDSSPERERERDEFEMKRSRSSAFPHLLDKYRLFANEGRELQAIDPQPYKRSVKYSENYALRAAAAKGHYEIVNLILSSWDSIGNMDFHDEVGAAFYEAADNGHEEIVKLLLASRWDVFPFVAKALKRAALKGHPSVVNRLITYLEEHQGRFRQQITDKDPSRRDSSTDDWFYTQVSYDERPLLL